MTLSRPTRFLSLLLLLFTVSLLSGACKTSVEAQKSRYLQAKDRLDVLAAKNPMLRDGITLKVAEFERQASAAEAKGGDAAIADLRRLVVRMESYEKQIAPAGATQAPIQPGTMPGGKLGGPAENAAGTSGFGNGTGGALPPPTTGKLGGPGEVPAGGSGFGGTGGALPSPAPGGSGFGSPAPGGAPAPSAEGFGGR